MADFNIAYNFLAPNEYNDKNYISNDPNDPGGLTKYGISKAAYPDLDIVNLTIPQAKEITRLDYWEKTNLSLINDQRVANALLDFFFQSGIDEVQGIQNLLINEFKKDIKADGKLGPLTAEAINQIDPDLLGFEIVKMREAYYRSLKVWSTYEQTFINRLNNNYAMFKNPVPNLFFLGSVVALAALGTTIFLINQNREG